MRLSDKLKFIGKTCFFQFQKYAIFLEEEVLPTADILSFFGQCLDVLNEDDSLAGVTAFNEHGSGFFSSKF